MKINFKKIDHIQICIPKGKETEARKFYIDLLGLEEIPKPVYLQKNGGFWLNIADIQLHIGVEKEVIPSKRHPAFIVENLETIKQFFEKKLVRMKEDLPIPNFRRFSFYDPFGNRIEFLEGIKE